MLANGSANDDTILIDFSSGSPLPAGGLSFDVTSGGGTDRLELLGTGISSVVHTFADNTSGTVTVDGQPIDHSGVAELRDTLTGGLGDETLDGGGGTDPVRGGGGSDTKLDDASEIDESFTYWDTWVDVV